MIEVAGINGTECRLRAPAPAQVGGKGMSKNLGIYEIADRILVGCRATYGEDWGGDLLRTDFQKILVITGIAKDQRTWDRYWDLLKSVGWITDRNGRVGTWNMEAYREHKRLYREIQNNGGGK